MVKGWKPPPKEPCRCAHFCMEDLVRTGRFCKIEAFRAGWHGPKARKASGAAAVKEADQ